MLIDASGAAWICDWNWPCLGASCFDLVLLLATAYADGHDATTLFTQHPTARGVTDEQLDAALATLSGFLLTSGGQPPADWSPHIRQHQTWCGEVTLRWLADRCSWTFWPEGHLFSAGQTPHGRNEVRAAEGGAWME